MQAQNPFVYGRPIAREEDLADREAEKHALLGSVRSGQPVILYAPRRYGKTSLGRVVASRLLDEEGFPFVYADFWGARSITDVIGVLGEAYARVSGPVRARRTLAEILQGLGFEVNLGGVLRVRYDARRADADSERQALRGLLRVPQKLAEGSPADRILLVLDEFGELNNVPGEPDAAMRSIFQDSPDVSFIFMGSKGSLMNALFSDRRRPFYNFGRRMRLGRLAYGELGDFVEDRFRAAGIQMGAAASDLLLDLAQGHPYRAQQIAFHAFELACGEAQAPADEETVLAAKGRALDETAAEFRAILDGMSPNQRAVYVATCREPTTEPTSRDYLRRHGIRSTGSVRSALRALADVGEIEAEAGVPQPTDPLFAAWVRERMSQIL